MSNFQRLEALIEDVPAQNKPAFRRFLNDNRNNSDLLGAVADLLAGGSLALAIDIVNDSRLSSIIATLTARVRRAFIEFVRNMRSPEVFQAILVLLESGQTEAAMATVDSFVTRMSSIIPEGYSFVGKEITEDLQAQLRSIRPTVNVTFNPGNPAAAEAAQTQAMEFAGIMADEQKAAIRQALVNSLANGEGPRGQARAFRDAIGLTDTQEAAVRNYRRLLEQGSKQALRRDLRDKRFDRSVENARNKPLTEEQIDRMVERYREKYLTYRADTIATTEATQAAGAANHEAFRQVLDQTGLTEQDVEKTWNSTEDGRTRISHVFLGNVPNNKVIGMETNFTSGYGNKLLYPGDKKAPLNDRVRCRCVCSYRLVIPE